jgi:hypothetical protein
MSKLRSGLLINIKSDIGAAQLPYIGTDFMLEQFATFSRFNSFGWIHPHQQPLSYNLYYICAGIQACFRTFSFMLISWVSRQFFLKFTACLRLVAQVNRHTG